VEYFFYINKYTAIILQDKTAIHAFGKLPKMKKLLLFSAISNAVE